MWLLDLQITARCSIQYQATPTQREAWSTWTQATYHLPHSSSYLSSSCCWSCSTRRSCHWISCPCFSYATYLHLIWTTSRVSHSHLGSSAIRIQSRQQANASSQVLYSTSSHWRTLQLHSGPRWTCWWSSTRRDSCTRSRIPMHLRALLTP
jgi:hypothetical protein